MSQAVQCQIIGFVKSQCQDICIKDCDYTIQVSKVSRVVKSHYQMQKTTIFKSKTEVIGMVEYCKEQYIPAMLSVSLKAE